MRENMNDHWILRNDSPYHKKKSEIEPTCNIIYNDCNRGIPDIARNETPEPFLSCRIPATNSKNLCFQQPINSIVETYTHKDTNFSSITKEWNCSHQIKSDSHNVMWTGQKHQDENSPELQTNSPVFKVHCLRKKIDTNRSLIINFNTFFL